MLVIRSSHTPELRGETLPESVSTALRHFLQQDPPKEGVLALEGLTGLDVNVPDGNNDVVQRLLGIEVVADGSQALAIVRDGLLRRLQTPVVHGEELRLVDASK